MNRPFFTASIAMRLTITALLGLSFVIALGTLSTLQAQVRGNDAAAVNKISKHFTSVPTMAGEFMQFGPNGEQTGGKKGDQRSRIKDLCARPQDDQNTHKTAENRPTLPGVLPLAQQGCSYGHDHQRIDRKERMGFHQTQQHKGGDRHHNLQRQKHAPKNLQPHMS